MHIQHPLFFVVLAFFFFLLPTPATAATVGKIASSTGLIGCGSFNEGTSTTRE